MWRASLEGSYSMDWSLAPCAYIVSGNIFHARAPRKGHGKLKLIFQHEDKPFLPHVLPLMQA
ncbi:hypothetical protein SLEP1_g21228 [Rubroshorea leprosula]|uniref:Uncharacterized protein n=1 Tax=Rubroshorea leprosula TaxID=152421 RepID=A0AAV5JE12_9ROSI|nr:hypothetical protein SLEP1_g21228 [Rubroshorea leprosula]